MRRRPPRSTRVRSSAASDVYKRQHAPLAVVVVALEQVVNRRPIALLELGLDPHDDAHAYVGAGRGHRGAVVGRAANREGELSGYGPESAQHGQTLLADDLLLEADIAHELAAP